MKKFPLIGQAVKPQGVRGEIKVLPATDDVERFCDLENVFLDEKGEICKKVESARTREGFAYVKLEGVDDRDEAECLRGCSLYIDRAHAVPLPEGRYYISDLIGMRVEDETGAELGRLSDVMQAGGNDVYEVAGGRTFRFPALKRVLKSVDVENGVYVVSGRAMDYLIRSVNFGSEESMNYFHRTLRRWGVIDALREKGAQEGDTVVIGEMEFDFVE